MTPKPTRRRALGLIGGTLAGMGRAHGADDAISEQPWNRDGLAGTLTLPNGEQALEIREANGPRLGFFVPEKEFHELLRERDAMRQELLELKASNEQLRRERDNYARILEVWEKEGIAPLTRRDVEKLERECVPFEVVIAEVEAVIHPPSGSS